jgi:hypothetical protein
MRTPISLVRTLFVQLSVLESCADRRTPWKMAIRKGFVDDRQGRFGRWSDMSKKRPSRRRVPMVGK